MLISPTATRTTVLRCCGVPFVGGSAVGYLWGCAHVVGYRGIFHLRTERSSQYNTLQDVEISWELTDAEEEGEEEDGAYRYLYVC